MTVPDVRNQTEVEAGSNYHKSWIYVLHSSLDRVSDSPFRSICPACDRGLLLVKRDHTLEYCFRIDNCSLCGQIVVYEDDNIGGISLHPSLNECLVAEVMDS